MNAFSVFQGACIFFASSFVGIWLRKRCLRKAAFYRDYAGFLCYALEKIDCERMIVAEIIKTFESKSSDFSDLIHDKKCLAPLPDKELDDIRAFIGSIGKTDAENQIASLRSKSAESSRVTEKMCADLKKEGDLRFKLCVLLGAALFIILV